MAYEDKSKYAAHSAGRRSRRWMIFGTVLLTVGGVGAWVGRGQTGTRVPSAAQQAAPPATTSPSAQHAALNAPDDQAAKQPQQRSAGDIGARARARAALERALPVWDDSINRLDDKAKSKFDPKSQDALKLAKLVTKEKFAFSEVRKNGRTVFKNTSQDSVVKVDPRTGYWKYISPLHESPNGQHTLSDKQAEQDALELFEKFELPEEEMGRVRAAGIAGASPDGDVEIVARSVRVGREVNGLPVDESEFTVTYNPDGTVARSERRWPTVELDGTDVATREQAVAQLVEAFEEEFASGDVEAGASLHYFYNEETGVHEPFLRVQVAAKGQDIVKQTVEYSLKEGVISEGAPGEEHDS